MNAAECVVFPGELPSPRMLRRVGAAAVVGATLALGLTASCGETSYLDGPGNMKSTGIFGDKPPGGKSSKKSGGWWSVPLPAIPPALGGEGFGPASAPDMPPPTEIPDIAAIPPPVSVHAPNLPA